MLVILLYLEESHEEEMLSCWDLQSALPNAITTGSDNNLWFTEYYQIGTITTGDVVTEYQIPNSSNLPDQIVAGPDRNLWFTEFSGNTIAKITTS